VSVFINASHFGLLVAMSGVAVISGVVLTRSIQEEDFGSSKIWGTVFGASSLAAAWSFWRLV
jgi:hypothetical protein